MKRVILLLMILGIAACARKVEVRAPELVRAERYSYVKDEQGRVYIVTINTKDFDEAMKRIRPGPATVDKLNLWVITPLRTEKKETH